MQFEIVIKKTVEADSIQDVRLLQGEGMTMQINGETVIEWCTQCDKPIVSSYIKPGDESKDKDICSDCYNDVIDLDRDPVFAGRGLYQQTGSCEPKPTRSRDKYEDNGGLKEEE